MSDGTTAVQVSPIPTEQDMSIFRQVMDNALNSIVQASELAKTVAALKVEVDGFKQDLEILRQRNRDLDEMLTHVRSQRDEAERKLSETATQLSSTKAVLDNAQGLVESHARTIAELQGQVESLKKQRDDWSNKWASESDKREAAEAKLADIQEFAQRLFPPKVTEPIPHPEPAPTREEVLADAGFGRALSEANAAQATSAPGRKVYEGEEGFDWAKPNHWDGQAGRYYNEVA